MDVKTEQIIASKHGDGLIQAITVRHPSIIENGKAFFLKSNQNYIKKFFLNLTHLDRIYVEKEVHFILKELDNLVDRIRRNDTLTELSDNYDDNEIWNKILKDYKEEFKLEPTYCNAPMLYTECFIYRAFASIFSQTKYFINFDSFIELKRNSFKNAHNLINNLLEYVAKIEEKILLNESTAENEFIKTIEACLWGNKCDLSLSHGIKAAENLNFLDDIKKLRNKIICNSTKKIFNFFNKLKNNEGANRIDIVLDNSGIELVSDFCFVEMLYALKFIDEEKTKVVFHAKQMPWFVSDNLIHDINWTLNYLKNKFQSDLVKTLATKWINQLEKGNWILKTHLFWTTPYVYTEMKRISPDLYEDLSKSKWILFKGDLNYRKLISDMLWDYSTKFKVALRRFWITNIAAFRTIKIKSVSEIERVDLIETFPKDWHQSGEYALIQFYCNEIDN